MVRASAIRTVLALTALFVLASPGRAAAAWQRPVDGQVQRPFHLSADRFAAGQHRGIDLAARPGEPVRAACAGTVHFAGRMPGGGATVSVRCGSLLATYQHLGATAVRRGEAITPGRSIGPAGGHLYLSARVAATGHYLDPRSLFAAARKDPPVGPAPRGGTPRRLPHGPPAIPVFAPEPIRAPAPGVPWLAWAGLLCLVPAIGVGGLVRRRTRRQTAQAGKVAHARQ